MADLTTLADLKAWLELPSAADTVNDPILTRLITAASNFLESWLNRTIASGTYTETRTGKGGQMLMLANRPVTAVASLTVNGLPVPPSPGYGQRGYFFDDIAIYLRGGDLTFSRDADPGNIVVQYTAGYSPVPHDIAQACIELCALRWKERDRIGLVSKVLAGETVSYSQKDMSADVQTLLNQYRNVVPL